jgi:hypothetical protein
MTSKPATIGDNLRAGVRDLLSTSFSEMAKQAAREAVAQARAAGVSASVTPLHEKPAAKASASGITLHEALGVSLALGERALQRANALAAACDGLLELNETLRAELDEMKKIMLKDGGIWRPDAAYEKGAIVTFDGAPWVANAPSSGTKPGTSNVWRLIGKSHR